MKRVQQERSVHWKWQNMKTVHHGKKCNTKRVQHEKNCTLEIPKQEKILTGKN